MKKSVLSIIAFFAVLMCNNMHAQAPGGVTQPISGSTSLGNNYVNGLTYKLYTTNGANTRDLVATPFGSTGDALVSTGYFNTPYGIQELTLAKMTNNYGIELSGKLYIAGAGTTYRFRAVGPTDDQLALIIDGVPQINVTTYTSSNVQSPVLTLSSGFHDITIRCGQATGAVNFAVDWSNNSGASYTTIPNNVFYTNPTGPSAWYKTDDSTFSALADGTVLSSSTWMDQSGKGNNVPANSGTPTYYKTDPTFITNYNPSIKVGGAGWFGISTSNYLKGFAYGRQGKTIVAVGSATNESSMRMLSAYGDITNDDMFGIGKNSGGGTLLLYGYNDAFGGSATPMSFGATQTPLLMGGIFRNNNITTSNNAELYVNNTLSSTATKPWFTRMTKNNGELFIGTASGFGSSAWNGNMNEIIYYPWDLSATELQKVNTYLAVKWGMSMASDYLNTSGAIIFGLTTNAGYTNRIFGIGREVTAEGLNQKQSQSQMISTTGYDFLKVSKGALATNNAQNTGTLADGDYLLLGDNDGALASQTTEIPSTFTGAGTAYRIGREWKVQETGAPGAVTTIAGSTTSGSFVFPTAASNVTMLVDTDGDGNFTTGTVTNIAATSVTSGVATFSNATIPNGSVITFAWRESSLSTIDNNGKDLVSIYPNPIKLGNNIYFRMPNSAKKLTASIYSLDGRKITEINEMQVSSGENSIKNPITVKGTYIVKFKVDGKEDVIKKIIVE